LVDSKVVNGGNIGWTVVKNDGYGLHIDFRDFIDFKNDFELLIEAKKFALL